MLCWMQWSNGAMAAVATAAPASVMRSRLEISGRAVALGLLTESVAPSVGARCARLAELAVARAIAAAHAARAVVGARNQTPVPHRIVMIGGACATVIVACSPS